MAEKEQIRTTPAAQSTQEALAQISSIGAALSLTTLSSRVASGDKSVKVMGRMPRKLVTKAPEMKRADVEAVAKHFDEWAQSFEAHDLGTVVFDYAEEGGLVKQVVLPNDIPKDNYTIGLIANWCVKLDIQVLSVKTDRGFKDNETTQQIAYGLHKAFEAKAFPLKWNAPVKPKEMAEKGLLFLRLERATANFHVPLKFVDPFIKGENRERCLTTVTNLYKKVFEQDGDKLSKLLRVLCAHAATRVQELNPLPLFEEHPLVFGEMKHQCKRKGKPVKERGITKIPTVNPFNPLDHPLVLDMDREYIETRFRRSVREVEKLEQSWNQLSNEEKIRNYNTVFKILKALYTKIYTESEQASVRIGHRYHSFKIYCKKYNLKKKSEELKLDDNTKALFKREINTPRNKATMMFISSVYCIMTAADKQALASGKTDDEVINKAREQLALHKLLDIVKTAPDSATVETFNFFSVLDTADEEDPQE
jgi:hypothetical protein